MDALRGMFPDVDPAALEATLAANGGSVERAVDFLLSGATAPDAARAAQEASDHELAQRLQAAEAPEDLGPPPGTGVPRGGGMGGGAGAPGESGGLGLPSLADVQTAVQPLVNGVMQAGRVAADSVSQLYTELVGDGHPRASGTAARMGPAADESIVLRGEAGSPGGSRATTRHRRPDSGAGRSYGDKKDD